jgi:hypothetical protein
MSCVTAQDLLGKDHRHLGSCIPPESTRISGQLRSGRGRSRWRPAVPGRSPATDPHDPSRGARPGTDPDALPASHTRRVPRRDRCATHPRRGRDLEPDPTAVDHDQPGALDEHVPQRVGLLDPAQVTPAILLCAGNIKAVHHRTGGEQQLSVVRPLAGRGPGGQAGRTRRRAATGLLGNRGASRGARSGRRRLPRSRR